MMERSLYSSQATTLRAIIDSTGAAPLLQLARLPGVRNVYRITVHHHDGRARDSVATLIDHKVEGARLEIAYRVTFGGKPLHHPIPPARYEAFIEAMNGIRFDHLKDPPALPPYGADLWLIERAAGTFSNGVIVAPDTADGAHASLVCAVRAHLPDVLREVR